jgi:hypothetical protein
VTSAKCQQRTCRLVVQAVLEPPRTPLFLFVHPLNEFQGCNVASFWLMRVHRTGRDVVSLGKHRLRKLLGLSLGLESSGLSPDPRHTNRSDRNEPAVDHPFCHNDHHGLFEGCTCKGRGGCDLNQSQGSAASLGAPQEARDGHPRQRRAKNRPIFKADKRKTKSPAWGQAGRIASITLSSSNETKRLIRSQAGDHQTGPSFSCASVYEVAIVRR